MSSFTRRATLTAAVALFVIPPALAAQAADSASNPPYSMLIIGASGVSAPTSGSLSARWRSRAGAGLEAYTPFHVGEVGAVLRTMRYDARTPDQPGFRAYLIGLDWRFAVARSSAVRPTVSVTAGDFLTVYDGDQPKGAGKESEIFVGAKAAVAIRIRGGTHATVGVTALQVLTSTPIRLTYATFGIAYALATPAWLRGALQ